MWNEYRMSSIHVFFDGFIRQFSGSPLNLNLISHFLDSLSVLLSWSDETDFFWKLYLFHWSSVFETVDLQQSFDVFYNQVNCVLNLYFPLTKVILTSRDPPHVTPRIKSILRTRNRLMHAGSIEKAAACTEQVSKLIVKTNSKKLARLSEKTAPKILWNEVNGTLL